MFHGYVILPDGISSWLTIASVRFAVSGHHVEPTSDCPEMGLIQSPVVESFSVPVQKRMVEITASSIGGQNKDIILLVSY